jgi:tetratricopeptide (TPR) repeat protein
MKIRTFFHSFITLIIFVNFALSQASTSTALSEYANGNYSAALKYFLSDITNVDKNAKQISMSYYNLNIFPEAEKYLKLCIQKDSLDYSSYYYLGKISKITGKLRNASVYFTKAIEKKSDYFSALFELSILNYESKNYGEAVKCFQKCIKIDSGDCLSNHYCGLSLFQVGSFDSALIYFKKAVTISPEFLPAINSMGGCYYLQKKYDSSIRIYKKSLSIDSSAAGVYKRLADSYYRADSNEAAINSYLTALNLGEKNSSIYSSLAWLYRKEIIYDSSIIYFKLFLEDDPGDAKRWVDLAVVYSMVRKFDSAKICYEKAIALSEKEISPFLSSVYVQYAMLLRSTKDLPGAVVKMSRSLELNDKNAYVYYNLGQIYDELKNNKDALKNYEKYLELETNDEKNAQLRGYVERKIITLKKK